MTDPLEWHADNLLAYFMTVVEDGADANAGDDPTAAAAMRDSLTAAEARIWPGFRHANIRGGASYDFFADRFPQKRADIAWFVEHYLRPLIAAR